MRFLRAVEDVLALWPFFLQGLKELNEGGVSKVYVSPEDFFKIVIDVIYQGETYGIVGVLESKNGKPCGFVIAFDSGSRYFKKTALIFAAYSAGYVSNVTRDMLTLSLDWAEKQEFHAVEALSLRVGNSIRRLYCKKLGFTYFGNLFRLKL